MRPADLDRLRDKMCVELLLATSSGTALQRYRLEEKVGYPAYDEADRRYAGLQPRDLVLACAECGQRFVYGGPAHNKRFCSRRCQDRVSCRNYWRRTHPPTTEVA